MRTPPPARGLSTSRYSSNNNPDDSDESPNSPPPTNRNPPSPSPRGRGGSPRSATRGRGRGRGQAQAQPQPQPQPQPPQKPSPARPGRNARPGTPTSPQPNVPTRGAPATPPHNAGDPKANEENSQAAQALATDIMRLNLQTDISIGHGGAFHFNNLEWKRVPIEKHAFVRSELDGMCHLPSQLQRGNHVPFVKAFQTEFDVHYDTRLFVPLPSPSDLIEAKDIIALSCSKIAMANDTFEAVKVAAIDAVSGEVLFNNFVCTDPNAAVRDWNRDITGLSTFLTLELLRRQGYVVFKGWEAVRRALFAFSNDRTIIVGHNLRSDLDTLRIQHGRAVDVARLVEKSADVPVPAQLLSLDSLCRELLKINLTTHPKFGRDPLQDAYATRELVLYIIKNKVEFSQWAKSRGSAARPGRLQT